MKSLLYYMSKIKQNYPQIEDLSIKDFENISKQINEDLKNNKKNSEALNLLATKYYPFLCYLTKNYEKYDIKKYNFDDFISYFYVRIMKLHKDRYLNGTWYPNYNCYVVTTYKEMQRWLNKILKLSDEPIENLNDHTNEYSNYVYQQQMLDVDIKDLANLLNNSLFLNLTSLEKDILIDYYGLDASAMTQEQIGKKYHISHTMVSKHIRKALEILRDPTVSQPVYEYYE